MRRWETDQNFTDIALQIKPMLKRSLRPRQITLSTMQNEICEVTALICKVQPNQGNEGNLDLKLGATPPRSTPFVCIVLTDGLLADNLLAVSVV